MEMEVAGGGKGTGRDSLELGCRERLEEETKLTFEESKWMGGKLRGSLVSLGIPVQDSAQ